MRKIIVFLAVLALFVSCKEELIKKPENLIDKKVMVDIIYDISILDAIRNQNPTSIDSFKINSRDFIFKKYKVDSLQFVKSNVYYSADYESYKLMFDEVVKRVDKQKVLADSLVVLEQNKKIKSIKSKKLPKAEIAIDTVSKARKPLVRKNLVKESILKKEPLE